MRFCWKLCDIFFKTEFMKMLERTGSTALYGPTAYATQTVLPIGGEFNARTS